jgi:chromosomal replication initiation ATPase DnaA
LSVKQEEKEIPQLKKLKPKVLPETVAQAVCREFDCSAEQVIIKGRKKNKAREVAIYISRTLSGMSCKELGLYFGGVSGALITIMYNRIPKDIYYSQDDT